MEAIQGMHDAIYYPSIRCTDRGLIASALFLWDSLLFIVPHKGMTGSTGDKEVDEALELVGTDLVPSDEAKREATREIRQLIDAACDGGIDLTLSNPDSIQTYPILPGTTGHQLNSSQPRSVSGPWKRGFWFRRETLDRLRLPV